MRLNVIFSYDVNTETGEMTLLSKEEVTVDTTASKIKKPTKSSLREDVPTLQLNANNFALNSLAIDLLKVNPGDTVHINYPKKDGKYVPVIGSSESLNVKSGNRITKALTVSFRGTANTKLAEFGTTFELIESERPGVFYLKGDKVIETKEDKEVIEIDDNFELDDLEDIDLDDDNTDISTLDLTL